MAKQKVKTKRKKAVRKTKPEEMVLVNFKVRLSDRKKLDAKAEELTRGNRSKLLLLAALNRKTPFQSLAV